LRLATKEGWQLAHVFAPEGFEQGYAVVLQKANLSQRPQHQKNR
jgi:hypothetical protein